MQKTAAFITLGCKINQYETQAIRQEVLELGYEEVPSTQPADVYVVNTCSVTAMSGVKSRKSIQKAARTNPASRIIVVGCSTPEERESFSKVPQVAFLAGNEEKSLVAPFLSGGWRPGEPFPDGKRDLLDLSVSRYEGRTRATIKVQDGCSNFCSFCIIPFLRGVSKSRAAEAVVEEVERLVDAGFLEIVLSGVHLQDWGLDLDPRSDLVGLLERLTRVPGLTRLRLSSLGARAFTPELLELLEHPVFCRHWHIPLQAGADEVLETMRRGYTVARFRQTIEELERRFDSPAITTDVIVGHPGETEAHFEETLARCREFGFSKIHVFPFSLRKGTLAEKVQHDDRVHPVEIRRRAQALGELDRDLATAYRERFLGRQVEVLVEGAARGAEGVLEGLTDRYLRVRFDAPSPEALRRFPNTVQAVRLVESDAGGLRGVWDETPVDADGNALREAVGETA